MKNQWVTQCQLVHNHWVKLTGSSEAALIAGKSFTGQLTSNVAPGSTTEAGILNEDDRIPTSKIPIGRSIEIVEIVAAV